MYVTDALKQNNMQKVILLFTIIISWSLTSAQYKIPDGAQAQLITKSNSLINAQLIANNACNVFVFKDNVFFSISGQLKDSTAIFGYPNIKPVKRMIVLKDQTIILQDKRIISISNSTSRINTKKKTEVLTKLNTTNATIFPSTTESCFFIVIYTIDKKRKLQHSIVKVCNMEDKTIKMLFEVNGRVCNISGNQSLLILSVDKDLILVKDQQEYVLSREESDITCVCASPIGFFFGTCSNVYYMAPTGEKTIIVEKGALQLSDCCNTLYMILIDGSLIRIHNTLAFAEFYNLFEQYNDEDDNTHH